MTAESSMEHYNYKYVDAVIGISLMSLSFIIQDTFSTNISYHLISCDVNDVKGAAVDSFHYKTKHSTMLCES